MSRDTGIRGCRVLVLLSGGMDSTAAVAFYLEQRCDVDCLFVDYGQVAATREFVAAQRVAAHYRVPLRRVTCAGLRTKAGGLVLGRNTFFLFIALMEFDAPSGLIAAGVHAGTPYYDCGGAFIERTQSVFDGYADGRIRIGVPFLTWSKRVIWEFCQDKRVPVLMTYSCELGREQPCGECRSCKDLEALHACPKLDA